MTKDVLLSIRGLQFVSQEEEEVEPVEVITAGDYYKKNVSYYNTPFGSLLIGIDAKSVDIAETESDIDVNVKYNLEVNYEHLADCSIRMHIKSKDARDCTLS